MERIPLNHEASAGDTHKQTTTTLPTELVHCLEKNRFLHLATCTDNIPHVSLMNYTYLPSSPFSARPVIVMTANPASRKMNNLSTNPKVSVLVHDWLTPAPPPSQRRLSGGSPVRGAGGLREPSRRGDVGGILPEMGSLAPLLFNMNTSAVASISATMNGLARVVERGSDEERFYRTAHLENSGFEQDIDGRGESGDGGLAVGGQQSGEDGSFVPGEQVGVILVGIQSVRIADLNGGVRDWEIVQPEEGEALGNHGGINGVR